ncbi:hypothetical protein Droror1_Dr00020431 [Drosera rotundifolia]
MDNAVEDHSRPRVRAMLQAGSKMGLNVCRTWAFNDGSSYHALPISPRQFDEKVFKRPLKTTAIRYGDVYIPRGVAVPALDKDAMAISDNVAGWISIVFSQVYPNFWTAILISLDNQGMWNIGSVMWARQYLGQQFYLRVWTPLHSLANDYYIPSNALRCGKAIGQF